MDKHTHTRDPSTRLLVDFPKENLKRMKNYQVALGRLQAIEVLLMLQAVSTSVFDPNPTLRFYKQRYAEAIFTYLEDMGVLNVFWSASPDRSFSWENTA